MKGVHVLQKAGVYRLSLKIEELSFSLFYNLANSGEISRTVVVLLISSFGDRKSQHLHWKCFRRASFQESTFQYEVKLLSATKPCTCPFSYGCDVPSISHINKEIKKICS